MIYLAIVLQWLHVLFAIAWFGSSVFILFVMVPTLRQLSDGAAAEYNRAVFPISKRFFPIVGGTTILLGIIRGLVLGISFTSPYGVTYILSVILGIAVLVYGARVTGANVERLAAAPPGPEATAALERTVRYGRIEFAGFLVIIALMVLMRFGY